MESIYDDVSSLYREALEARFDYLLFLHKGETRKLLKIAALQATTRLFAQEGPSALDRLNREAAIQFAALAHLN
jgi:hypothetical protein